MMKNLSTCGVHGDFKNCIFYVQPRCFNANLKEKEIGSLGKVFNRPWGPGCFGGAYASWLGSGSPTFMVVSAMDIRDDEGTVGLYVHELLHNLGVGHTQKRPGLTLYIIDQYLL